MMASESCAMCTHRVPSSVLTLDTFIKKYKGIFKTYYLLCQRSYQYQRSITVHIETCRQPFHLHASCIADGTVFFDASSGDITIDEQNNHVSITQGDWRGRMHDFAALEQDH